MPRSLVIALALFVSVAAYAVEPPRENEKWITLRADDIEIFSNASPAATAGVARDLLRMRAAVGQITKLQVRSPVPTKVFLFANERAFMPYAEALFERRLERVGGVFMADRERNFILLRGDVDGIDRVVYHELTHYFIKNTAGTVPLWLSEGMAEFYSSFKTWGDEVHIGRPIQEHVQWLRRENLIPLRELFAVDHSSPVYNENARQGVFYAQSWALVHSWMLSDERRPQFARFLKLMNARKPTEEAFNEAFGMTYAQMELELRNYVRKYVMHYTRYSVSDLKIAEPSRPEPLPRDALLYQLGSLLTSMNRNAADDGRRFLEETLRLNPSHADVYILLGRLIMERSPAKEQIVIARNHFTKATELAPRSGRAWLGVAVTYLAAEGDVRPGLEAIEKARSLSPSDEQIPVVHAQLRSRDQVRRINEAIDLANEGNHAGALAVLDRVIPEIADSEMSKRATELREMVAKHVKR